MSFQLPPTILFDLDDTILAYDAVAEDCWEKVCYQFATKVPGLVSGQLLDVIMETRRWYWSDPERNRRGRLDLHAARREVVSAAIARLGINAPMVANELADSYAVVREKMVKPIPGAIETLGQFRDEGVKLGLVTNGSAELQRAKIDRFGLGSLFGCILIEGEFGVGKPDERVYRHSLEQLKASPSETWMVGDNLALDVEAPQRLGIWSIWVDWAQTGLPNQSLIQPDHIIHKIAELVSKADG